MLLAIWRKIVILTELIDVGNVILIVNFLDGVSFDCRPIRVSEFVDQGRQDKEGALLFGL